MVRALIFGSDGQLGRAIAEELGAEACVGLGRGACDVTDVAAVRRAIEEYAPRTVYNCAAYNNVDGAESDRDAALTVNALAPGAIASACLEAGARLVHFSTDYVFGRGHTEPIDESRRPEPLSVYARSKWAGERAAIEANPRTFVVRCCGLYSERRANFVRTMARLGRERDELSVVCDQFVSPTWVEPLARVAIRLADSNRYGTYHAAAHGECSWYEFACAILDGLGLTTRVRPVSQASWGAKAERPQYSVLDNAMLRGLGLDDFEPWDEALARFLASHSV